MCIIFSFDSAPHLFTKSNGTFLLCDRKYVRKLSSSLLLFFHQKKKTLHYSLNLFINTSLGWFPSLSELACFKLEKKEQITCAWDLLS